MDKKILNQDYIFLDQEVSSIEEAFEFIASKALELKIVKDQKELVEGFKKRESEGTTGFEDGFAIPHARIKGAIRSAILVTRFKKGVEWKAMDGNLTEVAIALIVPESNSSEHMNILSEVAQKLMDEKFRKALKQAKNNIEAIAAFDIVKEKKQPVAKKDGLNILAITACVTGVAHTYMAEDKLLETAPKMGHNIRVETHGSKGIGTPFTNKEIQEADLVLFAVDIGVDKARFAGKKFYQTKVAQAIRNPEGIINDAINKGTVLNPDINLSTKKQETGKKTGVLQHILAGISYMIPVIVLGGISLAFSLGVAKAIWGPDAGTSGVQIGVDVNGNPVMSSPWGPLHILDIIGGTAFSLMISILAGFIANSIAGRAAIAPAMVGAFIGNDASKFMPMPGMAAVSTPTGFVGALIAGLLVGYFVKWVNTWKVPKSLRAAMPIFFIPLMAGIGISVIFIYLIGGPIGYIMDIISGAINNAYKSDLGIGMGLLLGALLGAMAGFDMGGPINKIAFVTSSALIVQGIQQPMGAMAAAIPVAPLGMGLTTILFKRFFTKDEIGMGTAAIIMGTIGISEGAIPFAIRDPKRAIASNATGSLVAGAIAGAFQIKDAAAHGGPIVAVLGAIPYGWETVYYFIAVIAGVAVTTFMYGFWLVADLGKRGSVKESHNKYLGQLLIDKKEKLGEIKVEIKALKSNKKTDNKSAIENLLNKRKEIISEYNTKKKQAKDQLKLISKDENAYIKTVKSEIKSSKLEIIGNRNNELKTEREKIKQITDKNAKKEQIELISNVKEKYTNEIIENEIKYRKEYVDRYNKSIMNI